MRRLLPQQLGARLLLSSGLQLVLLGVALGLVGYATGRRESLQQLNLERQRHQLTNLSTALSTRLRTPQIINRDNVLAIRQGVLNVNDFEALGQRFWRQMQLYPVGYINWGSTTGRFLGVERLDNGRLVLNEDSDKPLGRGQLGVYALGAHGKKGPLLEVVKGMSLFHQEAWYADTIKANTATWSSIYQWEDKPQVLAISYNEPVLNSRGELLGVIGVDFVLSQLSTWLQQLWQRQPGLALIVEPNGALVASSSPKLSVLSPGSRPTRARLDQLSDPLARAAGQVLKANPHRSTPQTVAINGRTYSIEAWPWGQAEGLNWRLITAISQDTALEQSLAAAVLGVLALAGAIVINRQLIGWLLEPMELLKQRAAEATGNPQARFTATLPDGAASELVSMADSLGGLVEQLQRSTQELAMASARERRKDAHALELLKSKLRSSLEASAVAHEIKLPLSEILLNSQLLLQSDAPPRREQLQDLARATEAVLTTIETMRTLLRNVQTSHQPLNLAQICRSALLYLKPALAGAAVEVESSGLERACTVMGDATQLQIAIVNVLSNSLQALQQQSGPRRIAMTLKADAHDAVLRIDDNGPGLPPELELLEPLESARPAGTGLGLFVVRTTLEHHSGSIALARSSDLGGASVSLRIPRAELPTSG